LQGFVVVYDITQEETFDNVLKWLWNIEEHASEGIKEKMILGNNCHMDNKRVVSRERGEQRAIEHGARFFEVSAEKNINIEEALYNLAEKILEKKLSTDNEETSQNIRVSDTEEKKGRCF
ncbi:ras-related protein Rab-10-like, partial [Porites lutea]|uniref:ras-related protein Rab-10-like n=1 Tax=Porites lutea TaxID=51062 RepID=UPI003CC677F8